MSSKLKKLLTKKNNSPNIKQYLELDLLNSNDNNIFFPSQYNFNLNEENDNNEEKGIDNNFDYFIKNYENEYINQINSEEISEKNINQNNEIDNEFPIINKNFISICQCCKNKFDSKKFLPYLFKCGHFFCLQCINKYFTEETGIFCPSDGQVAKSINELKLLENLIEESEKKPNETKDKKDLIEKMNYFIPENESNSISEKSNNNNNQRMNYCNIHNNQKLSHIICDTNEVICVHCAFDKLKANPNIKIKEIKEKYKEYSDVVENIITNSQKNIELITNTLELTKKNRENEIKKINIFYNNIINFIEEQKKEKIQQVENVSSENIKILEQKLLLFNETIEKGEELQKNLEKEESETNQNYYKISNNYNEIVKLNKTNNDNNINNKLKYIKFENTNESVIKEYLNNISSVNIINRIIKYIKNVNLNIEDNIKNKIFKTNNDMNNTNKSSNQYNKIMSNKKLNLRNNLKKIIYNFDEENNINNDLFITNSPINSNETNSIYQNYIKINNFKNKISNTTSKNDNIEYKLLPLKKQLEKKIYGKNSFMDKRHNSLLESYFELKKKEKLIDLNNCGGFTKESCNEKQKSSKSFNSLNILNNFYNLNYTKKNPIINDYMKKNYKSNNSNKNLDVNKKLYNISLSKLIPEQMKKFNKTLNFQ